MGGHVRFGSLADMCNAKRDVRFTPNSDRESGHVPMVMSALPPKADMFRFGPKADMPTLFDHLVGAFEQRPRHRHTHAFAVLRLMANSSLVGC
jgi:hypothetical protein